MREEKDERVEDIELAHYMALTENVQHSEADAYANYLEHPETYVGSEHSHFRELEEDGILPVDIIEIGQKSAESSGDVYAFCKQVENLQKEGKRWELFKLSAKHGFEAVGYLASSVLGTMKNAVEIVTSSEKREQFKKELKHNFGIEKADPKEARKWSMNKHDRSAILSPELVSTLKFVDTVITLFTKYDDDADNESTWNMLSEMSREEAQKYYTPKNEKIKTAKEKENDEKEDSTIGAEFVDYIFNTEADFYDDFLGGKNIFGGSIKKHFESLKEKGIDPEAIRRDGKYWKKIMADLKIWNERLRKVDVEEMDSEIKENLRRFNQVIFGLKKYKKGEENKYMQDYIVSMYKFFKTCYVQARIKSTEKSGEKTNFAFGSAVII